MKPRFVRRALVAVLVLGTTAISVAPSLAAPIDDKRAQAQRLQQQIDANGERISMLGERYNGAQLAFDAATARIADAQRRYDAAERSVRRFKRLLADRAAALYRRAGSQTPLSTVDVSSVTELSSRSKYARAAADADGTAITRLQDAQDVLSAERKNLEAQRSSAKAQRDEAAAAKREIETANAEQRQLLGKVKGELAVLVAQEQQRRAEAARRAALARTSGSSGRRPAGRAVDPGSVGGGFPDVPAPSSRVAAVIAYARAQLGKPYVFNTAGPDTFDCSGLTMMAWRQAGVYMAHYSGAQFSAFPHVPISQLQPGDLVFKGPGGRDHVALYIGGGMQIAATHTGDYVRLQPLSSNLSGAVRPG